MIDSELLKWLLAGDVSIQYQVYRDLLKIDKPDLKERIAKEGWGHKYLLHRNKNEHWGLGFYQPKWTSTHYTLLELRNLSICNNQKEIQSTINKILKEEIGPDGGINAARSTIKSDVCINGMILNYASYFETDENKLKSIVDFILSQQLKDGGFNCQLNRKGAVHSSLHSTLSVIEGILEYTKKGYNYRLPELQKAEKQSQQFILEHKLYQSHRTGKTISNNFLMLSYPNRWRYDILRALDYFYFAGVKYDKRMNEALNVLLAKQRKDKTWPVQNKHTGLTYFDMELTGKSSRWNTLRAIRVLHYFGFIEKCKFRVKDEN